MPSALHDMGPPARPPVTDDAADESSNHTPGSFKLWGGYGSSALARALPLR